jgi:aryl-alcohol dehydrogenase-like predicted oxidoreductase
MQYATPKGTREYMNARRVEGVSREHFRKACGLWLSSVGLGTYLGAPDDATDELYRAAIVRAVESGCNVLDTAINYRCQRSERSIGRALTDLAKKGIGREQVVVATKGGFIPFDEELPTDLEAYLEENYHAPGILNPDEVVWMKVDGDVVGCHAMTPRYLENQLERSLENLDLETVDIYYLHNPETQLNELSRHELMRRLRTAFEFLEKAAADGKIRYYGTATWNAYRQSPKGEDYLPLAEVVSLAREVGGEEHRLRFIQLPHSLAAPEAFTNPTQEVGEGQMLSPVLAAGELGTAVVSSASIGQGRLTQGLPDWLGKLLKGFDSDVQRAIQFARSTPGLTTALVGMKEIEHVDENMAVAKIPPVAMDDFLRLFEVDNR